MRARADAGPRRPALHRRALTLRSFADIPGVVARRVGAGERVALILLDAFGLQLLERERDHPLWDRLHVTPLRGQFPSTTTAHVTTVHFGVPVGEHGLYEWRVLEPSLDEIIVPLMFRRDAADGVDELAGALEPASLAPGATVYEQLGVPTLVVEPLGIGGAFDRVATVGAVRASCADLADGLRLLNWTFRTGDVRYAYLYWGEIDRIGHRHGPSSDRFRAAARAALDAVAAAADALTAAGVTLLFTADHGQVDVAPERVDQLDRVWPELSSLLTHRAAGSARDVFLHVVAGEADRVVDELASRLGDRAHVCHALDLFDDPGPRLRARLGDVAVLPAPGREAWLAATPSVEAWNRGQHGGLTEAETSTYLAEIEP